jgi:hypothetical protein
MRFGAGRRLLAVMRRSKGFNVEPQPVTPFGRPEENRTGLRTTEIMQRGYAALGRGTPESQLINNNRKSL